MGNCGNETILVVDDAIDTLEVLSRNLIANGFKVFSARDASEAIDILENAFVDLVITDNKMPGISGIDLIRHIRENYSNTEVIMITGYPTIESAVQAVKKGAEEYLTKPFTESELMSAVRNALNKLTTRRAGNVAEIRELEKTCGIIGESELMLNVFREIAKAASTNATVLVTGESGTGKELVCRAVHYNSKRGNGPFVPVNCGGIPEGLLESELFGYVRGAFTGATQSRAGFFQTAEGGTICLDEIGEISMAMQVKLLRILQDKEVYMVGATKPRKISVRILAATNKDLHNMVEKGTFREDLYFRLNVLNIDVPPLRARGNDIIALARQFIAKYAKEYEKKAPRFSQNALEIMKAYSWPGNVRELENLVQRLVVMSEKNIIEAPDLPAHMRFSVQRENGLNRTLENVEIEYIKNVLASVEGNKTKAAKILNIDRKTLRDKIKKMDAKELTK